MKSEGDECPADYQDENRKLRELFEERMRKRQLQQ